MSLFNLPSSLAIPRCDTYLCLVHQSSDKDTIYVYNCLCRYPSSHSIVTVTYPQWFIGLLNHFLSLLFHLRIVFISLPLFHFHSIPRHRPISWWPSNHHTAHTLCYAIWIHWVYRHIYYHAYKVGFVFSCHNRKLTGELPLITITHHLWFPKCTNYCPHSRCCPAHKHAVICDTWSPWPVPATE